MIKIICNLKEGKLYITQVPFSKGFNEKFVQEFSIGAYGPWDEEKKAWCCDSYYLEEVEDLLTIYFPKEALEYSEE